MFQSLLNMALKKDGDGRPEILQVTPKAAIAGGEFQIHGKHFTASDWPRVTIGDVMAPLTIGSDSMCIVAADIALIGEVGLSGELRAVGHLETRLKEAAKLGFKRCLLPASSQLKHLKNPPLALIQVRSLAEALESALI